MLPSLLPSAGGGVLRMMKAKVTASRLSLVLVIILSVLIVGPQLSEANLKVIITIDGGWRYLMSSSYYIGFSVILSCHHRSHMTLTSPWLYICVHICNI